MPDYGQKATDAEFRRLRAKINDVYRQAYKEIEQKGREFAQAHARREAQMRQMVADGKMTQADFDAWMRGQVFQGEQWQKKKQQMADTLYHADQVAQEMVNDSRFNVFAANANYMGYSLEHDAGIKTNFGLYDADSVRRLVKKEPDLLPPKKMVGKDKSYQWYNRQVQTAITQGIIQGESLDKIAHRIGKQTGETSMTAMLRNARTMQTGAQNAGRIEGLHQAQELGIKVKKQWMATLDSHTRDAHADLDGQIADVDEPFDSELGPIMYPGDPDADPANVWNCRCTLVYVYPEYPNSMERRDNETGENVGDMSYREWEEMKRGYGEIPNLDDFTPVKLIGGNGDAEVTDDIHDYYLPQATRDRLDEIESLSTYNEFSEYLDKNYGVQLDTGLDALKGARADDSISAVKEQCQKITIAIDAYRETFGDNALSSLKKVYLYDKDLDVRAAYFFNMVGENDPLAGEIHFSQWGDDGRTIFHELAHAYQDSHKMSGEDAITYSERVIRDLGAEGLSAYAGASEAAYAAEQFADAFGFGFSHGSKSGLDFINRVAEYEHRRRRYG